MRFLDSITIILGLFNNNHRADFKYEAMLRIRPERKIRDLDTDLTKKRIKINKTSMLLIRGNTNLEKIIVF